MRQLISQPNKHAETMFGIIYEPYELLDGRFQVIGEIIEGWDALIELEETIFKIYYLKFNIVVFVFGGLFLRS